MSPSRAAGCGASWGRYERDPAPPLCSEVREGPPGWWSSSDVATFDGHSQALSHQVANPWLREHAQLSQGARCVSGRKSWSGIPIVVTSVTSVSPRQPTPSHLLSLPTGMVSSPWESSVQLESSHSPSPHSTEGWYCHFHFIDYKAELSGHLMAEPRFKAHAVRPVWINTDHTVKFEFPMNSKYTLAQVHPKYCMGQYFYLLCLETPL